MKSIFSIVLLFSFSFTQAQKHLFLRVYDLSGSKIAKGEFISASDSSLTLKNGKNITIPYNNIGNIKTGRTIGHYVWKSAFPLAVTNAITTSIVTNNYPTSQTRNYWGGESALIGGVSGAAVGFIICWIDGKLKGVTPLEINGDMAQWQKTRAALNKLVQAKP